MDYNKDFEDGFEHTSLGSIHFKHHAGTGKKLIFLHGFGADTKSWEKLMEQMPQELDIFLIDLLGFGESDKPEIDYTISTQFQMLREFIALQNSGDSYIIGHSYGAWVVAYYASQPYTCKGIVLIDSAGVKQMFDELEKDGKFDEEKEKLVRSAMMMNNNEEHVLRSAAIPVEDSLSPEMLNAIKVPALIIWGKNDTSVNITYGKILNTEIKNSKMEVIDGAGHTPHYTNADKVASLIIDFIGR